MKTDFFTTKLSLLLSLLLLLTASCAGRNSRNKKLNADEIESKFGSAVVLVKNTYYYTISFNGGRKFYFTGIDKDGDPENLTLDPDELTPVTSYGTGFIISDDGLIATNSHVASPSVDIASARTSIMNSFRTMANELSKEINETNEKLGILQLAIYSAEDYSERRQYEQMYEEMVKERDSKQEAVNAVHSLGSMDYEARVHTDIGIAYNDTHVTDMADFHPCVAVADDPTHDLAILQLKDKSTPEGKYVFTLEKGKNRKRSREENSDTKNGDLKVGKKLYMIGFNLGPTLALTSKGLKAQITQGEVSQDTDDSKVMYTISALHGSSGSPVLDEYGKLVAINFAGLDMTQNFNYGIKSTHLKKLLHQLHDDEED